MPDPASPSRQGRAKKLLLAVLLLACVLGLLGYQLLPMAQEWWEAGDSGPLPAVNLHEIVARYKPETAAYHQEVEAQALSIYFWHNWWHIRSYFPGRTALRLFIAQQVGGDMYGESLLQKADRYARCAHLRGSDDPLVNTICDAYLYQDHYANNTNSANEMTDRALALAKSEYPPACKLGVLTSTLSSLAEAYSREKYRQQMGPALARLPSVRDAFATQFGLFLETKPPAWLVYDVASRVFDVLQIHPDSLKQVGDDVGKALESHPVDGSTKALCKADFYISWAWAARGSGWADSVTQLGWQLMRERLQMARTILTDAQVAFPKAPRIPTMLITVELGDGGSRAKMEEFFQQAVTEDPDCCSAYDKKMYFLQPRWHGSLRDVFSFGLECVKTGRWDAGIPLVLCNGLHVVADQQKEVYQVPAVWTAVSQTYEEFLKRYPDSTFYRTRYLEAAHLAGQWKVVKVQLEALGDNWDRQVLSDETFATIRQDSQAHS